MKKEETNSGENYSDSEDIKRWTAKRKSAVVLDIIKGITTAVEVAREHGLTVGEVEEWVDTYMKAGEEQLRSRPRDVYEIHEAEKKELYAQIGKLTLEKEILKKANRIGEKD